MVSYLLCILFGRGMNEFNQTFVVIARLCMTIVIICTCLVVYIAYDYCNDMRQQKLQEEIVWVPYEEDEEWKSFQNKFS